MQVDKSSDSRNSASRNRFVEEVNMQNNIDMEELDEENVLQKQKARLEQEIDKSRSIMEARKRELQQVREQYRQEMELRRKEMKAVHQNWVLQRPDRLVKRLAELQERVEEQSGQWDAFREYLEQWQSQVNEQMKQMQEQISIQQEQMEQIYGEIESQMAEQREWMQNQVEQIQGQAPMAAAHELTTRSDEEIEMQPEEILDVIEESEE
jgi:hypothetical protein